MVGGSGSAAKIPSPQASVCNRPWLGGKRRAASVSLAASAPAASAAGAANRPDAPLPSRARTARGRQATQGRPTSVATTARASASTPTSCGLRSAPERGRELAVARQVDEHVDLGHDGRRIGEREPPQPAVRPELGQASPVGEEIERTHPRPSEENRRGRRCLAGTRQNDVGSQEARLTAAADLGEEDLAAVALDLRVRQAQRGAHSMMFFSIGSTVTPCSRNQATAASISS